MVKYFLKDSEQEIHMGDTIEIKVPFKTKYGEGFHQTKALITQAMLLSLIEDGLIVKKEIKNKDEEFRSIWKPFIKGLIKDTKLSFDEAMVSIDVIKTLSPQSFSYLLLDLISRQWNKGKQKPYIVCTVNMDIKNNNPIEFHVGKYVKGPWFSSRNDAQNALILIAPYISDMRHEQKD